jgi:hypothetical protein
MQGSVINFFNEILVNIKEIRASQTKIEQSQIRMELKIDEIHLKINNLINSMTEIKSTLRDEDDKLFLMSKQLDRFEKIISDGSDELNDDYTELSKRIFQNWEDLEELSKKFIPVAEYLYSKLQLTPEVDFSPVVLQYCRALENEFLHKIFSDYTLKLIKKEANNIHKFLFKDQKSFYTKQFAGKVKKAVRTNHPEYTLGEMNKILSFINNVEIKNESPLLIDFREFLSKSYDVDALLSSEYIKVIDEIVRDFRNPSAHPEFIKIEIAQECKSIIPDKIDYLLNTRVLAGMK